MGIWHQLNVPKLVHGTQETNFKLICMAGTKEITFELIFMAISYIV